MFTSGSAYEVHMAVIQNINADGSVNVRVPSLVGRSVTTLPAPGGGFNAPTVGSQRAVIVSPDRTTIDWVISADSGTGGGAALGYELEYGSYAEAVGTGTGNVANYNFDGGTDGTAISTSDTHSGDSWDVISGSGGTVAYEADAGLHGGMGGLITDDGFRVWAWYGTGALKATEDEYYLRFYFKTDDPTPTSTYALISYTESNGSTVGCQVQLTSGGNLRIREGATGGYTTLDTSSHTLQANEWYRVEVYVRSHATTGRMEARLFWGDNLEGATADETLGDSVTNVATGDGDIEEIIMGFASTPGGTASLYFDSISVDDTDWVGSAVTGATLTDSNGDYSVTFDEAFASAPTVLLQRITTNAAERTQQLRSVSTTGFTARFFSGGTAQATSSIGFHWTAIGTRT